MTTQQHIANLLEIARTHASWTVRGHAIDSLTNLQHSTDRKVRDAAIKALDAYIAQ